MSAVTKPFSKAPRYIDWARPHTWKDPKYVKPDYAAAFTLIRDILTEKPRSFHAIIEAGLQRHAASQPGSSTAASSKSAVPQAQGGRLSPTKKKLAKKEGLQVIPEGHPFVSNKFLKTQILPVLASNQLIHLKAIRPVAGTVPSEQLLAQHRVSGSPFHWFLSLPPTARKNDPLATWSVPAAWDRICSGEFAGTIHAELKALKKQQEALDRERRLDSGKEKRKEMEYWTWDDRQPELTTRKQRFHLSRRKQKSRTKFEYTALRKRVAFDKIKERASKAINAEEKKVVRAERKRINRATRTAVENGEVQQPGLPGLLT